MDSQKKKKSKHDKNIQKDYVTFAAIILGE